MDLHERWDDPEEAIRTLVEGELKKVWTVMPVIVSEDTKDGHTASAKAAIKGSQMMPDGTVQQVELPVFQDMTVAHHQGGLIVHTNPVKKGDEALALFHARPIDAWHAAGDVQTEIDKRTHALSDSTLLVGHRSDARKIKNVAKDSGQIRSEDGKHTIDHHPSNGTKIKTVDKDDKAENPFADAKKFYEGVFHPSDGVKHNATDNDTTHSSSLTHSDGFTAAASNAKHTVKVHPDKGVVAAAANDSHKTTWLDSIVHTSSSKIEHNAPTHNINGNTNISGNTSITGALSALGGMSAGGGGGGGGGAGISSSGDITAPSVTATGQVAASGYSITPTTVALLPASPADGDRAYVTDATSTSFFDIVAGGGSNHLPVFYDGGTSHWRIG